MELVFHLEGDSLEKNSIQQPCCMYLRKSRADLEAEAHGELETLSRHEKILCSLAERMNLSVTTIYKEIVSGETITARPVAQQLLSEVERGMWSGVLVMEIERIARGDTIDQGIVARAFKMSNTRIITPNKVYDPNDEYDEEYFEFGLFMSRREYKTINRRIQRGRIASVKEGKALFSIPPYGYDKVKINGEKGWTLSPNETEEKAVRFIFELYNHGYGMTVIANRLDELGIKPRHLDFWSKGTINGILKNPVYIGMIRWSYKIEKRININGEIIKKQVRNDACICVQGLHPAIITKEVFDKAQQLRLQNTHKCLKKDLSLKNPLAGILFCENCGVVMGRLGASSRTKYDTIKCSNKNCDNISAPLCSVEKKLVECLKKWLFGYSVEIKKHTVFDEMINGNSINMDLLKTAKDAISKIEKQILQTYDLVESGVYTKELFLQRNKELYNRKTDLLKFVSDTEEGLGSKNNLMKREQKSTRIERVLDRYFQIDSAEVRNHLLKTMVEKVEYLKTEPNRRGNAFQDNFELLVYPKLPMKE